jgi:hypothetical protein
MRNECQQAVQQVLEEARRQAHLLKFSDAERLAWILQRMYELGRTAATRLVVPSIQCEERSACSRKRQTSR